MGVPRKGQSKGNGQNWGSYNGSYGNQGYNGFGKGNAKSAGKGWGNYGGNGNKGGYGGWVGKGGGGKYGNYGGYGGAKGYWGPGKGMGGSGFQGFYQLTEGAVEGMQGGWGEEFSEGSGEWEQVGPQTIC